MPSATLGELAELTGGRVEGNALLQLGSALPLQDAQEDSITLIDNAKYLDRLANCPAAAVVSTQIWPDCKQSFLIVEDVHQAFQTVAQQIRPQRVLTQKGVDATATIDSSATVAEGAVIGRGVNIGADCVIGKRCHIHANVQIMPGCQIGNDCTIYPNVVLYENTLVGHRVTLHSGVVLGADGFGYKQVDGKHIRSAQIGWVEIGDDVDIGANSTVDRGAYGATRVGDGTKLDNQVQIGHNCQIGRHSLLCAQVGIAGSSTVGDYVTLAGQVGVADHIHIADGAIAAGKSGVMQDIRPGELVMGCPAAPGKQRMHEVALVSRLPTMRKELRELKRQIEALQQAAQTTMASTDDSDAAEPGQRDAA